MTKLAEVFYLLSPHTKRGHFDSWIEQISDALDQIGYSVVRNPTNLTSVSDSITKGESSKLLKRVRQLFAEPNHTKKTFENRNSGESQHQRYRRAIHMYLDDVLGNSSALEDLQSNYVEIYGFLAEPTKPKIDRLRELNQLKGLGVFSDEMKNRLHQFSAGKLMTPVYVFNDFPLSREITKPSGHKRRILLIGDITERKNLDLFLKLSNLDTSSKNEWRIVGRVDYSAISVWAKTELQNISRGQRENLILINRYVDESEFIEEIAAASLVFILYNNWSSGSNVLTNAILQHTPSIVRENTSLASIVEANSAGMVIGEEQTTETLQKIQEFLELPRRVAPSLKFYQAYSRETFNHTLFEMLGLTEQ